MRMISTTLSTCLMLSTSAFATSLLPMEQPTQRTGPNIAQGPLISPDTNPEVKVETDKDRYQIGDEWGKKFVDKDDLEPNTPMHRAAYATARLGGGTSFFLGEFDNQMILATNHHVCPGKRACIGYRAKFTLLGKEYKVTKHLGDWQDIDAALLVIDVPNDEDRAELLSVAANFEMNEPLYKGQELITVGYGIAFNEQRKLVANRDSDCVVFSDEVRYIPDPDRLNPGDYDVWSFANGCDISHGDSGSAMVDRNTGKVVGIIWTGNIPKDPEVLKPDYLSRIYKSDSEDVWKELSYAVAATAIGKKLRELLEDPDVEDSTKDILLDIVD